MNQINMMPEFTNEGEGTEEVKPMEMETPADLPPATDDESDKPLETVVETVNHSDNLSKQLQGLQEERAKLLREIQELRGQRRELKKDELQKVENKIDIIEDVNPADVALIDKVIRAKGYLTREESQKMFYDSVKNEEINKFLEKHPEYKPENDPNDINWNSLQREFSIFRAPEDPRLIGDRLERAHKSLSRYVTEPNLEVKKQQVKTASLGSGTTPKASPKKTLDPTKRLLLEQGGWTEAEIREIENKL